MQPEKKLTRITIDLPTEIHRCLKTFSAITGRSMRKVIIDAIAVQIKDVSSLLKEKSGRLTT